jgi:PAS domain S-box-containing protein
VAEDDRPSLRELLRARALFERTVGLVAMHDATGTLIFVSPRVERALGYVPAERVGRPWRELLHPDDATEALDAFAAIRDRPGASTPPMQMRLRHKDGSYRWVEGVTENLLDHPDVRAFVSSYHDVTRLKHAEQALVDTRAFLEKEQESGHLGSWSAAPAPGSPLGWSREAYRIFGLPDDGRPLTTADFLARVHPDDHGAVSAAVRDSIATGRRYALEHRIVRPDGTVRWVQELADVERAATGEPVHLVGVVQDITERRLAEGGRDRLFSLSFDMMCVLGFDGRFRHVNPAWERTLGWSEAELKEHRWPHLVHPDDRGGAIDAARRMIGASGTSSYAVRCRRKDGEHRWLQWSAIAVPDEELVYATVRDVTERKQWEDAMRASEERYRLLFRSSPLPAWLCDAADLRIQTVNEAAVLRYGFTQEELAGRRFDDLCAPDLAGVLAPALPAERGAIVSAMPWQQRTRSGEIVDVELTAHRLLVDERDAFLVVANDVTERRRLEVELAQAQKMEAVGRLAGGIAHDFNNMLSAILGFSRLIHDDLAPSDPMREDMAEIIRAAERSALLTRQLLAFSRRQILEPRVVDLGERVAEMERMLRRLIGENIELALTLPPRLGRVKVDPGQMEQVLLNLVLNARDAMPRGGRLAIELADLEVDRAPPRHLVGVPAGAYVELTVSDTGSGMPSSVRERVFEPFFTTKEDGRGTGLGLATVYGVVKQSGGHVSFESEPGRGTTFRVHLPRTDEEPASRRATVRPSVVGRGETVLIVEDEAAVRQFVRKTLERGGYLTLEAADGDDALRVAERRGGAIDLLLTDVVMPRMSGPELVQRLSPRWPGLTVVYMSGYAEHILAHQGVLEAGAHFIAKPVSPNALLVKLAEALAEKRAARR